MARTRNTKSTLLFLNEDTVKTKMHVYTQTLKKHVDNPIFICVARFSAPFISSVREAALANFIICSLPI